MNLDKLYQEALVQGRAITVRLLYFEETCSSFLLLKRAEHQSLPGHWEPPGGRVEKNELPLDGLIRELYEETQLRVAKDKVRFFAHVDFTTVKGIAIREFFFVAKGSKKQIVVDDREHTSYVWVSFDQLPDYLAHPFIKTFLLKNQNKILDLLLD